MRQILWFKKTPWRDEGMIVDKEIRLDEENRLSESCLSDSNENCKLIGKMETGISSLSNEINGYSFHPWPLTFCNWRHRAAVNRGSIAKNSTSCGAHVHENSPASSTNELFIFTINHAVLFIIDVAFSFFHSDCSISAANWKFTRRQGGWRSVEETPLEKLNTSVRTNEN